MDGGTGHALSEPGRVVMRSLWVLTAVLPGLLFVRGAAGDEQEIKFADCPAAVKKTLEAESKGAKIETVTKETDEDDETVYWADAVIRGTTYAIGVLEDGTLSEMNLAVDEEELPLDRCPAAVQATFKLEAFGSRIDAVGKDVKYGVTIYEAAVEHKGRSYEIIVAEDGTLVEKVLVIDDEEIELAACPAAVQIAFREHSAGGTVGDITRSMGIGHPTYEAEVEIKGKVYLIEVSETGHLISKSLEAVEE
jgi:hypothetical protein